MFNLDLGKAEEPGIKLSDFTGSQTKQGIPEEHLSLTDYAKAFDCVGHDKFENPLKSWEYQTILPVS